MIDTEPGNRPAITNATNPPPDLNLYVVDSGRISDQDVCHFVGLLSPQEKNRLARLRRKTTRRQFVIGRGLLRTELSKRLSCSPGSVAIEITPAGKPFLVHGTLQFNLSHSRERVALAIGRCGCLGVDIEYASDGRDLLSIARAVFPDHEWHQMQSLCKDTLVKRFYRNWTLYEALIKAEGGSIHSVFTRPRYRSAMTENKNESTTGGQSRWRYRHLLLRGGYHLGLAARGIPDSVMNGIQAVEWIADTVPGIEGALSR